MLSYRTGHSISLLFKDRAEEFSLTGHRAKDILSLTGYRAVALLSSSYYITRARAYIYLYYSKKRKRNSLSYLTGTGQ